MKFWNSLVAQEVAAVVSALVLAIGAVIEYWSKIKVLTLLALKWILRRSTQFDRCTFRRLLSHSIGPILVVLGIAGEFIFEGRTFVLGYRQEQQAENAVASLQEKASANEREAEQLRKDAECEHLVRVQLEASMEWRRLSKEQENKLCSVLGPQHSKEYRVVSIADDMEAWWYSNNIRDALNRCAGLKPGLQGVGYMAHWPLTAPPLFGVWIAFDAASTSTISVPARRSAATNLRRKLEASGVNVAGLTSDGTVSGAGPGSPVIFVGPRSPPNMAHSANIPCETNR